MSALELCLPVGTQRHRRVIAANSMFPEVRERRSCFCQITEETEAAHPCLPLLSSQNLTHGAAAEFCRHTVNEMRRECVDESCNWILRWCFGKSERRHRDLISDQPKDRAKRKTNSSRNLRCNFRDGSVQSASHSAERVMHGRAGVLFFALFQLVTKGF